MSEGRSFPFDSDPDSDPDPDEDFSINQLYRPSLACNHPCPIKA
jgi:hypothetical protein